MEVLRLNEQLRDAFACVTKYFMHVQRERVAHLSTHAQLGRVSASGEASAGLSASSTPPAVVPIEPMALTRFVQLAQQMLKRINRYQYATRAAFLRDLQELHALAPNVEVRTMVQQRLLDKQRLLLKREQVPPSAKPADDSQILVANEPAHLAHKPAVPPSPRGGKVCAVVEAVGVPSVQRLGPEEWACNANVLGSTMTLVRASTQKQVLAGYERKRLELAGSRHAMAVLTRQAREQVRQQQLTHAHVLRDARKQILQRLPSYRIADVTHITALQRLQQQQQQLQQPLQDQQQQASAQKSSANGEKLTKPGRPPSKKQRLRVDTAGGGTGALAPLPLSSSSSSGITTPVARRAMTQDERVKFLRLRRLIQMRLCRHLDGEEICVRNNEDPGNVATLIHRSGEEGDTEESWKPTGRLEKGKVLSYASRRHVKFADFVVAELKRSVAACSHIFLVRTRESIDDHLLVCDAFDEDMRDQLGDHFREVTERYMAGKR